MDQQRAVRIAVEAMREQIKRWAFDANLHDQYGIAEPYTLRASKRKHELQEAIEVLQGEFEKEA